jgi:hypothetical protein
MQVSPSIKPMLWGTAIGAIAIAIVGFSWGGWVTQSTATAMAKSEASREVANALAPICFLQFNQQPSLEAKLTELKGLSSYQRAAYVEQSGAALMPGSDKIVPGVATACAELVINAAK